MTAALKRVDSVLKKDCVCIRYAGCFVGYYSLSLRQRNLWPFMTPDWVTSLQCIAPEYRPNPTNIYTCMYFPMHAAMLQPQPLEMTTAFMQTCVNQSLINAWQKFGGTDDYIAGAINHLNEDVYRMSKTGSLSGYFKVVSFSQADSKGVVGLKSGYVPAVGLARKKIPGIIKQMGIMMYPRAYAEKRRDNDYAYVERKFMIMNDFTSHVDNATSGVGKNTQANQAVYNFLDVPANSGTAGHPTLGIANPGQEQQVTQQSSPQNTQTNE